MSYRLYSNEVLTTVHANEQISSESIYFVSKFVKIFV